ncbi:MarR family winged helix-turn-helix transcriptional regulator [Kribbella sp. CWNU-51]
MDAPTLPFGTAIALAERNLRGPLAQILTEEDLEPGAWFTLNALGLRGAIPTTTVRELLSSSGYDDASVDALLARLATVGLIEDGNELLRLTPAGAERYASVGDRIGTATRRVFSLFDATQVETARTLLQQIAETDPATIAAIAFDEARA